MDEEQHINEALPDALAGAIATYEMYKNYRAAGFDRSEAIELIAALIKINTTQQPPNQ
jgi:hypothetical protein